MAEEMEKPPKIEFRISDIRFLGVETTKEFRELKQQLDAKNYGFGFSIKLHREAILDNITLELKVTFYNASNPSSPIELANMKCSVQFYIKELSNIEKVVDNKKQLPMTLMSTMAGIAVSSARGMFAIVAPDSLKNAIIPPLNPNDLVANSDKKKADNNNS